MRFQPQLGLLLACGLFAAAGAQAADVYRWVDEQGRVNFADTVPDKYRASAKRVDARPVNIVGGGAAAADRTSPPEAPSAAARTGAGSLSGSAASATAGRIDAPARPACAQQWQAYFDSQACFSPYRMANGALRAEAYGQCGAALPEPSRSGCPLPVTAPGSP